jgi:hypothetical protein
MIDGLIVILIISLAILALNTWLIMTIWNKVIIKKFPNSDIVELNFWDALAISVFVTALTGGSSTYIMNQAQNKIR